MMQEQFVIKNIQLAKMTSGKKVDSRSEDTCWSYTLFIPVAWANDLVKVEKDEEDKTGLPEEMNTH